MYVTTSTQRADGVRPGRGDGQLALVQCLRAAAPGGSGCGQLSGTSGLSGPGAIVVSPDGGSVYVANTREQHDPRVRSRRRTVALALKAGRSVRRRRRAARDLPVHVREVDAHPTGSRDRRATTLYVASSTSHGGVTALTIGAGGGISAAERRRGACGVRCMNPTGVAGLRARPRASPAPTRSPFRAARVYAATTGGRSIVTINRDPGTGLHGGRRTRASATAVAAATRSARAAAGRRGHRARQRGPAVRRACARRQRRHAAARVLTFDPTARRASRAAPARPAASATAPPPTARPAVGSPARAPHLITTPDGQDVYVAGSAVVELDRAPGHADARATTPAAASRRPRSPASCSAFAGLGTPTAVAIAPDGRHVYAIAAGKVTDAAPRLEQPHLRKHGRDRGSTGSRVRSRSRATTRTGTR